MMGMHDESGRDRAQTVNWGLPTATVEAQANYRNDNFGASRSSSPILNARLR